MQASSSSASQSNRIVVVSWLTRVADPICLVGLLSVDQ
jgi:hypothetical protein